MNLDSPHPIEIAGLMRELAARLLDTPDVGHAVHDIVTTVHDTLSVPCGVSLWGVSHPAGLAARPSALVALNRAELRAGDGPGLVAIRLREPVACFDVAADRRWPDWRREALRHGVRSALISPIDVGRDTVATLSLYATEAGGVDTTAEVLARVLAEHSGLLLAHLLRQRDGAAIGDPPVLHRASGVIMAQWGCAEVEARSILEAASAALAIPLAELAERLVTAADR
ncbi:GAF domain-containing protein [Catenuloplanes atrovinosus]|uniref:GAF domain-containing protein n=1 Tax=Catenuloplanes atrovinosus TaxID=137266 RepID=A0AAE3YQB3_9ACTN|nr:GAF domain-containing protein [Catenuloplanes atrovinosus]MDR7276453.1 GAF domain-containing protein [Catenuloplanes atrovinosus]